MKKIKIISNIVKIIKQEKKVIINFRILYKLFNLLFLLIFLDVIKSAYLDLKNELKKRIDEYQKVEILYK